MPTMIFRQANILCLGKNMMDRCVAQRNQFLRPFSKMAAIIFWIVAGTYYCIKLGTQPSYSFDFCIKTYVLEVKEANENVFNFIRIVLHHEIQDGGLLNTICLCISRPISCIIVLILPNYYKRNFVNIKECLQR